MTEATPGRRPRGAELRLFLRDGKSLALAWQATLRPTGDLYAGRPRLERGDDMRGSFHASGAAHFHYFGQRILLDRLPMPMTAVQGTMKIVSSSVAGDIWRDDIEPRDSARRRTLVLDLTAYPVPYHSWQVTLWAVEAGRRDLAEALKSPGHGAILGRMHADWTDPQLVAVVTSIDVDTFETIARALEAEGKTVIGYPRERKA
jgi:hypothetical protein